MRAGRADATNTKQDQKRYGLERQENYKDCELSVMKKSQVGNQARREFHWFFVFIVRFINE